MNDTIRVDSFEFDQSGKSWDLHSTTGFVGYARPPIYTLACNSLGALQISFGVCVCIGCQRFRINKTGD